MNKKVLYIAGIATVLGFVLSNVAEAKSDVRTVSSVDLNQYKGNWYEIAKFPNRFQRKCSSNTTANYSLKENGRIEVLNQCTKENGEVTKAIGEAKVADKTTNSKLKVRFAPGFLSFIPFVWADYWIIDLDQNYKYAVVGTPDKDYLWILSRTPTLDETTYQGIISRAKAQGFDINRLEKTVQK
ncbi:MAG: lipocalin family protein [Pyrinomonadaceae bacterium]|nr:lipocalin family protein [Pyrinomonadaceae bacterium]